MSFVLRASIYAYNLEDVLHNMEIQEEQMKSVQFSFEQQVEFKSTDLKETIKGSATFEKPGKIRISKESPQKQLTLSNGQKMWIYTPSYKQAWVGKMGQFSNKQMVPEGLFPLSHYVTDLKKRFNVSLSTGDFSLGPILHAIPKEPGIGYELVLYVSSDSWVPVTTIYSSESARIRTSVTDLKINPLLSSNTFKFSPPKGTDIIELN